MTTDRDRGEEALRSFLDDGATTLPDRVLDAVLDELPATPQRRASGLGSLAIAAAAFGGLAAAVLVLGILIGGGFLPRPPAGQPTASPTATPILSVDFEDGTELRAGRYLVPEPYPAGISFEVPNGWSICVGSEYEQGVCGPSSPGRGSVGVTFLVIENVMADPCGQPLNPAVGPNIDDIAAAIASLRGFTATPIESLTVDGHDARELTVTAPPRATCDLQTWITPSRTNGVGGGEANLLRLIDVDGVPVMLAGVYYPLEGTDRSADAQIAELRSVIDSVRIAD